MKSSPSFSVMPTVALGAMILTAESVVVKLPTKSSNPSKKMSSNVGMMTYSTLSPAENVTTVGNDSGTPMKSIPSAKKRKIVQFTSIKPCCQKRTSSASFDSEELNSHISFQVWSHVLYDEYHSSPFFY